MTLRLTIRKLIRYEVLKRRGLGVVRRLPIVRRFYAVFAGDFDREFGAVLAGRVRYFNSIAGASQVGPTYLLRRNTHRLEKALVMRPRRAVFARGYILETVQSYDDVCQKDDSKDEDLRKWSRDVLDACFEATEATDDPIICKARDQFRSARMRYATERSGRVPFCRATDALGISIDDFHSLCERRRSCRWYQQRPVPREVIDRAVAAASLSPSACNRQPFSYRIFDDPQAARKSGAVPKGTAGFSDNFTCLAVLVGDLSAFPGAPDRHVIYIDGALSAMSFQFALEVQGVGSCCINWPDRADTERELQNHLSLEEHERVIMFISFGYPDESGKVPYSQKKPIDEIRRYE